MTRQNNTGSYHQQQVIIWEFSSFFIIRCTKTLHRWVSMVKIIPTTFASSTLCQIPNAHAKLSQHNLHSSLNENQDLTLRLNRKCCLYLQLKPPSQDIISSWHWPSGDTTSSLASTQWDIKKGNSLFKIAWSATLWVVDHAWADWMGVTVPYDQDSEGKETIAWAWAASCKTFKYTLQSAILSSATATLQQVFWSLLILNGWKGKDKQ